MSRADERVAILLFAHGSRVEEANQSVRELAREVERQGPYTYVRPAFLELGAPNLAKAVHEAAEAGLRRVIIIPYFLMLGLHLRRDLPSLVEAEKQKFPDLEIIVGQPLEGHPLMTSIIFERIQQARG